MSFGLLVTVISKVHCFDADLQVQLLHLRLDNCWKRCYNDNNVLSFPLTKPRAANSEAMSGAAW